MGSYGLEETDSRKQRERGMLGHGLDAEGKWGEGLFASSSQLSPGEPVVY